MSLQWTEDVHGWHPKTLRCYPDLSFGSEVWTLRSDIWNSLPHSAWQSSFGSQVGQQPFVIVLQPPAMQSLESDACQQA